MHFHARLLCSFIGFLLLYGTFDRAYCVGSYAYTPPDNLSSLRYEISNHEQELRALTERLEQQEQIVDTTRASNERLEILVKQLQQESGSTSDAEEFQSKTGDDLHRMQVQSNSLIELVDVYSEKLKQLEVQVSMQSEKLDTLEKAVQSLVAALQPPKATVESVEISYRVVEGDTLEKIARRHGTSIKALKEANHLQTDKILIGQKLKIPQ